MSCVTLFFVITGLTSYFCFGQNTESIISLNLPNNTLSSVVKLTYVKKNQIKMIFVLIIFLFQSLCGAIFFTYPIQLFPVIQILEGAIFRSQLHEKEESCGSLFFKRNILRTFLVIFTALAAVMIPHFGEVIGLIGSIGASMLAFTLPAVFYLRLFGSSLETKQKLIYYAIICFGVLGGLAASFVVVEFGED